MTEEQKRLTVEEVRETPEYSRLTSRQQAFVLNYCAGGLQTGKYDATQATLAAYNCKSVEIARIMSYSLMANIRIAAVLNRHFNATPTEQFMLVLDRAIHNKKLTTAQLGALKLKCEVMGILNKLPDEHTSIDRRMPAVVRSEKAAAKAKKAKPTKPASSEGYDF